MNYLAHIFLSGSDRKVQFGNFISDAVKGNSYSKYPQAISDGILLHRFIDSYTDTHPAVRRLVRSLRPHFGRYSGILLDIYFDYLLASRFQLFSETSLQRYAGRFYLTILRNYSHLPDRMRRFMWHFIGTNRLNEYASKEGIRRTLTIMVSADRIGISVDQAIDYLTENEEELWDVFQPFFKELQVLCDEQSEP